MGIYFEDITGQQDATFIGKANPASPSSLETFYSRIAKRGLDVVLVLLSMPFVLPVVGILALALILTGNKPFYTQLRVGRNGKEFRMWKLRTMVPDADIKLKAYLKQNSDARREWNLHQKIKNDPRIVPIGKFLRATSLDELPQLFNVLSGSMALVGPRPIMVDQKAVYPSRAYYHMLPGLTGLWQISDRNECTFGERAKFDDVYLKRISLREDLRIMMQTVLIIMKRTGY
ncbi:MAG: sugar transferase [Pseudomonadota bacterium]